MGTVHERIQNVKKYKVGRGKRIMRMRIMKRDIDLILFLGKYKEIKGADCKKIYKSVDYYRKRLKALEKAGYVKREGRIIKLDVEGKELFEMFGHENYNLCRNKDYKERLEDIKKIAMLSLGSEIEFTPSWELKDKYIYTNYGKRYIGNLRYDNRDYIVYYISNRHTAIYAKQVLADIKATSKDERVILFIENFKILSKTNNFFITDKKSTLMINPTDQNLELMQFFEEIDIYEVLENIYKGNELLISNWFKADYMTEDGRQIICIPFIDVNKLHILNCRSNNEPYSMVDIITLQSNTKKVKEILKVEANIIELDSWIDKYKEERATELLNYKKIMQMLKD